MFNIGQELTKLLTNPNFVVPLMLWTLVWKGLALWKAADKKQLPWFVIIMLVNTMGLLEIAYVFYLNKFDLDQGKLLKFVEQKFGKKTN